MAGDGDFGAELTRLLQARGIAQAEFARRVGKAPGVISFIRSGRRTPPLDQMQRWADAMGLAGAERARFLELAALAHTPPEARQLIARLRQRCARLEGEIATLKGVARAADPRQPYRG